MTTWDLGFMNGSRKELHLVEFPDGFALKVVQPGFPTQQYGNITFGQMETTEALIFIPREIAPELADALVEEPE